ncbi:MAG: Rho termination factor N-terminal domain-containing protein, partial [Clostridium sp.]
MREKLKTLSLPQLRELAKTQGIKGITVLKKAEIIDKLCEIGEQTENEKVEPEAKQEEAAKQEPIVRQEPVVRQEPIVRQALVVRQAQPRVEASPRNDLQELDSGIDAEG